MEHVEGVELIDFLNTVGRQDDIFLRYIFTNVLYTLNKLHMAGIAHRDIKPENIMITTNAEIKVIDLGFSHALAGRLEEGWMRTRLGSTMYMAPEIIAGEPYQGTTIDIFSLGVTMLVMRSRRYPFDHAKIEDARYQML